LTPWILAPDTRLTNFNDTAFRIEPEALDGEFDDPVAVVIKAGRFDIDRNADTGLEITLQIMEVSDGSKSLQHPEVGMAREVPSSQVVIVERRRHR